MNCSFQLQLCKAALGSHLLSSAAVLQSQGAGKIAGVAPWKLGVHFWTEVNGDFPECCFSWCSLEVSSLSLLVQQCGFSLQNLLGCRRQLCWPCLDGDLAWYWLFSVQMIIWKCGEVCCESLKAVMLISVVRQWGMAAVRLRCSSWLALDYLGFFFKCADSLESRLPCCLLHSPWACSGSWDHVWNAAVC